MSRTVEDLYCNNLKILQDDKEYRFTSDSILLANFFKARKSDRVVELCSGSGVISILGTAKTNAKQFDLFEIQPNLAKMCEESVKINNLTNIFVHNCDLRLAPQILQNQTVDVVVVNPPYYKEDTKSSGDNIDIATHERTITLKDIAKTSSRLLKFGGDFYMVHIASRLAEICYELVCENLQPKHIVLIKPTKDKAPNVVLIKATKNAKVGVKIDQLISNEISLDDIKKI